MLRVLTVNLDSTLHHYFNHPYKAHTDSWRNTKLSHYLATTLATGLVHYELVSLPPADEWITNTTLDKLTT
jgi:hypothetical protein